MNRIFLAFFFIAIQSFAYQAEYSGRVYDNLDRPIPGPRLCWQADTTRCVIGNDSGFFRITFPTSLKRPASHPTFHLELGGGLLSIISDKAQQLTLEWIDAKGVRLGSTRILTHIGTVPVPWPPTLSAHARSGLYLLRISGDRLDVYKVVCLPSSFPTISAEYHPAAFAKTASISLPRVITTKPGYRKKAAPLYDDSGLNWIALEKEGDTGYFRSETLRLKVTAIDSEAHLIRTLGHSVSCESGVLSTEDFPGSFPYAFAEGKLFLITNGCQGFRLTGC